MNSANRPRNVDEPAPGWAAELLAEMRALRLAVERQQQGQRSVRRADRAVLERLLPVIAAVHGSEEFLSADLVEADAPGLRLVCAGISARSMGRLLRRTAGNPVGGYMVERLGLVAGVAIWRVVAVPEFPGGQKSFVPHDRS